MSGDPRAEPGWGGGGAKPGGGGGRPPREMGELGLVLDELISAGVPWLAVAMTADAGRVRRALDGRDVTVVGVADPRVPPVMVNPFEPEPGFPVQAHGSRLAGLLEAVFAPPGPVAQVIRGGLLRSYADCGWDTVTGATPPGARTPPAVPSFAQLHRATLGVAEHLGCDRSHRAAVRAFFQTTLEEVWTAPAGRFLEGGHPADIGGLLRGNVLLAGDGLIGDEAGSFLAGVVLSRVAERVHVRGLVPRFALVLADVEGRPGAARWFDRLAREMRPSGLEVITARLAWVGHAAATTGSGEPGGLPARILRGREPVVADAAVLRGGEPAGAGVPVLRGRRSAGCGAQCWQRPCSGYDLHAAGLLARDDDQAWLRLWAQTLLLAFLTGRPLPRVPAGLLATQRKLGPRRLECVLVTILDGAVTARAAALRPHYDPAGLLSVVAAVAARMLDDTGPAAFGSGPVRAGPAWVIPQLRWLHEVERLDPLGGTEIRLDDVAPPLDFGLAGLPDWPGIRIRDRLAALGRHPLSMASPRNRRLARVALLGEDGRAGLDADLAGAALGLHPAGRLPHAARLMGAGTRGPEPGWLEVVLSWPDRVIRPAWEQDRTIPPAWEQHLRPSATG